MRRKERKLLVRDRVAEPWVAVLLVFTLDEMQERELWLKIERE